MDEYGCKEVQFDYYCRKCKFVVRKFSKEYISSLEEVKAIDDFKQYVIKDMDMQLLDRINELLNTQGEIVIKKSDPHVNDQYETGEIRFEGFICWQPLVRCKDCKFYHDELCDYWALPRMVEPMDYCSKGEKICLN